MIGAGFSDDLVIGLVLGFLVGLLAGPALRSWLDWREWLRVSREAYRAARETDLMVEMLELMELDDRPRARSGAKGEGADPPKRGTTLQGPWQRQQH